MQEWPTENIEALGGDILRDFCEASAILEEQFSRFDESGTLSDSILRAAVGKSWDKGLLWRLKDKAHNLFRREENPPPADSLLDWSIGYIFHECRKLLENVHLDRHYAPKLKMFAQNLPDPETANEFAELADIHEDIVRTMRISILRVRSLTANARKFFCRHFAGRSSHLRLARFLYDENELARRVFGDDYGAFIKSVYGDEEETLYITAARSLLQSARFDRAREALDAALRINPSSREALEMLKALQNEN
ncbi:MAG: tetratricopeptide repeat protein [Desulfovibrio sp.]|jgi:tetratricopeptide (TPR) repeat protein|nr:tetratricopeptide repeat protein [Desulfovibrio sp.]